MNQLLEKNQKWRSYSRHFGKFILGNCGASGYPPSPSPVICLDWRGVRKKCLQNLENKGVAVFFRDPDGCRLRLEHDLLFWNRAQG